MKIKIIDLLNMISKGEEIPKKVMSRGVDWELGDGTNHYYYLDDCGNNKFMRDDLFEELYELHGLRFLNDEVEIEEEEKIPEKLEILNANEHSKEVYYENYSKEEISLDIETLQTWVNKIIDYLQSKGE